MYDFKSLYAAVKSDAKHLPVTFTLDGKPFSGFPVAEFPLIEQQVRSDDGVEITTIKAAHGENLSVRIELEYDETFGALTWTVWFENNGSANSPVIANIDAAHIEFVGESPRLKGIFGDHQKQYAPYDFDLTVEPVNFFSNSGRPTHVYFPYYNIEYGDGGCLSALGWGGTWEADFRWDGEKTTYIGRGTNGLCTYLMPGESIRTPRMAFIPYEGRNDAFATNKWRRWYIARVLPKANGEPVKPFSTTWLAGDTGLPNSDGSISERYFTWKPSMEKMVAEGVHIDYRWLDAGWYTDACGQTVPEDWWGTIGTWELDPVKWPGDTFRESTDWARAHGMRTLMWFEPERVTHVLDLEKNYGYRREWALGDLNDKCCGNNLGDPDCLNWTCSRILDTLSKGGVEMYREDNNFNARPHWAFMDTENRTGIIENKSVCGHYELWDRIIAFTSSHGGDSFVDSCASGGGRNDLESMRRGIPLLRSDADRTTTALRLSMTSSFNKWIPFCGALCTEQAGEVDPDGKRDVYILRASYLAALNLSAQWTQDPDTDFDMIRFAIDEWNKVNPYLLKDFYTLTPWHDKNTRTEWTAFTYLDGDKGVLLAFRMEDCEKDSVTVTIPAWKDGDVHMLTDADTGEVIRVGGATLTISRPEKRTAALYYIS